MSNMSLQISRFITGEEVSRVSAINALGYYWDPVTWLFPPVHLIPLALERVSEQQIEAILICPEWKGAMWWPQSVELRDVWLQSFCQHQVITTGYIREAQGNFPTWVHFMLSTSVGMSSSTRWQKSLGSE